MLDIFRENSFIKSYIKLGKLGNRSKEYTNSVILQVNEEHAISKSLGSTYFVLKKERKKIT